MKIFMFAHQLVTGGTAVNAIELAATIRDMYGHEVVLFASPGRMSKLVEERGVRYIPAPDARYHPTWRMLRALWRAVREVRPDIIHAWDWWQCIDAYYHVHLMLRVPMVVTDMTMGVTRVLPKRLPATWGTPDLVERARAAGRDPVALLLPPVDIHLNAPGVVDPAPFKAQHSITPGDITLVTVSRLAPWLKGESLRRTIDAVGTLARRFPVRLLLVGDGEARPELERLASAVNETAGRTVVSFAGMMVDPRPAYAAADIVIGMGGSALRGMAFAKPVVVVGEQGFSLPLTPDTAATLYHQGMYGLGDGDPGNTRFIGELTRLCEHRERLSDLGRFSRDFVSQHFSLERVSAALVDFYGAVLARRRRFDVAALDGLRMAAVYLREKRFRTPSRSPDPAS